MRLWSEDYGYRPALDALAERWFGTGYSCSGTDWRLSQHCCGNVGGYPGSAPLWTGAARPSAAASAAKASLGSQPRPWWPVPGPPGSIFTSP